MKVLLNPFGCHEVFEAETAYVFVHTFHHN